VKNRHEFRARRAKITVSVRRKCYYCSAMLTDKDNLLRRLHALRSEHRDLDTVIARITDLGPLDQLQVQRLKKRKLGLKDEISRLESRLIPDWTA